MIKINLTSNQKSEIEKIHIDTLYEGNRRPMGLMQILAGANAKSVLQTYRPLYDFLFDQSNQIRNDNVKRLLTDNKQKMQESISKIGKITDKNVSDKLLNEIFVYEKFKNWSCSKEILQIVNVNVCPYCNRQYTFTLKKQKVRPQFDHFFPKSYYPYLALSLYNLIPSCSICNQAKSNLDTATEPVLYPYDEEFGYDAKFETNIKNTDIKYLLGLGENFNISIHTHSYIQKKAVEMFHLEPLYNQHKDYVSNMFKLRYLYSDTYLNNLITTLPKLFRNKDELISTLFMSYINKDDWCKRPLSKLTFDICKELNIISTKL